MPDQHQILQEIYDSIVQGDKEAAVQWAQASIAAQIPAAQTLNDGVTPGIRKVGDRFGSGEIFLPEMVQSAEAVEAVVALLTPLLGEGGQIKKGKILIGTVEGDIHDIGKNIVTALLSANGYEVIDIGRNIRSMTFLDEAERNGARIIGMSGLLTTSLPIMNDMIEMMLEEGVRDRYYVIIGGGPTSQKYADQIGADGYANTAHDAVRLCDRLLGFAA